MPQQWFTVRAQAEAKAVQVSIRGIIGEWGLSDREFIRDVEAADDDIEQRKNQDFQAPKAALMAAS